MALELGKRVLMGCEELGGRSGRQVHQCRVENNKFYRQISCDAGFGQRGSQKKKKRGGKKSKMTYRVPLTNVGKPER